MRPFWVTFYSYKGGVGRTLALVNSGVRIAQDRRSILLVDFDLEAPGLDSFSELGVSTGRPGVVEYFTEFMETGRAPQLSEYIEECQDFSGGGRLWVMPSGRKDREYNLKRDALNWSELYDTGLGALMIEEWKAEIQNRFQPDYVFVDSRTGLTDIGGVCTLHLPDLVVMLFALNKQNVEGIACVLAAIRGAVTDRRPDTIAIATPVPETTTDTGQVAAALAKAAEVLGQPIDLQISYNATAALSEKVFALEKTKTRRQITVEYEDLVVLLKAKNVGGLDDLLQRAEHAIESDDDRAAHEVRVSLGADYPERADAVQQVAELVRRFDGREAAVPFWQRALELDPTLEAAFNSLVNYYKAQRDFEKVIELCRQDFAVQLPQDSTSWVSRNSSLGEALMALNRPDEAVDPFERCFKAVPLQIVYLFNFAEATRRSTRESPDTAWSTVIQMFSDDRKDISSTAANQAQAMHIPYACLGEVEAARDLLNEAQRQALALPPHTEVFSVKTYRFELRDTFLQHVDEALRAIDAGTLWDGMLLPSQNSANNT